MSYRLSIFFLFLSQFASAQCGLLLDSVVHTDVTCNGRNDGTIKVYTHGGWSIIRYSNSSAGASLLATQPFDASSSLSSASGSGPTNRWWSPSSCSSGAYFQYSSTQGCTAGSALFTGNFNGYVGCFLRSPQVNMNGINTATITFDVTNS
jgi:hypothetical protein